MTKLTYAQEIYLKVLNKEVKRFPIGFWTGTEGYKNSIECGILLFEYILKWNKEDIKKNYFKSTLEKFKLGGMLQIIHNNSPFLFLDRVYPQKFNEWDLSNVPQSYYKDINNRKKIIDFLLSKIDYKINLFSVDLFRKYGVESLLNNYYNSCLFKVLEDVYPDKYKPWELSSVPNYWWDVKDNRKDAVLWMLNELNWSDSKIKSDLCQDTFKDFGLSGLLMEKYNGVPFKSIDELYPNKFKAWEFKSTPDLFWDDIDNRIDTIDWALLKNEKDIRDITYTDLKNLGLRYFLNRRYDNNIEILKAEYVEFTKNKDIA